MNEGNLHSLKGPESESIKFIKVLKKMSVCIFNYSNTMYFLRCSGMAAWRFLASSHFLLKRRFA